MGNPFLQPYKENSTKTRKLYTILVFSLFIFLFLFLFKPFGISALEPLPQLFITMGFGLITAFILIIYKFLIEPVVINEKWTLGKNIIWDILIASSIGAANYYYICIIFHMNFTIIYFLYSIWTAILVGSIPVTISYFIVYNRMYKSALKEADIPETSISWDEEITISAGNKKNDFIFNPKSIVYLCSNDNYVTIVTLKNNIQSKTTIRGTLKSAEFELRKNTRFIRCHKCYIVNLDYVERVTGHNQKMRLKLIQTGTEIPVSRAKADLINRKTIGS